MLEPRGEVGWGIKGYQGLRGKELEGKLDGYKGGPGVKRKGARGEAGPGIKGYQE